MVEPDPVLTPEQVESASWIRLKASHEALREQLLDTEKVLVEEIGKGVVREAENRNLRDAIGAVMAHLRDDSWTLTFQTYGQLVSAIHKALAEIAAEGEQTWDTAVAGDYREQETADLDAEGQDDD